MKRFAFNAEFLAVWLVFVAMSCLVGCASDRTFLSNAAADYTWREASYERRCVEKQGPADCAAQQADVAAAKRELVTADKVIAIGKIPKDEKAAITAALKKVQAYK